MGQGRNLPFQQIPVEWLGGAVSSQNSLTEAAPEGAASSKIIVAQGLGEAVRDRTTFELEVARQVINLSLTYLSIELKITKNMSFYHNAHYWNTEGLLANFISSQSTTLS